MLTTTTRSAVPEASGIVVIHPGAVPHSVAISCDELAEAEQNQNAFQRESLAMRIDSIANEAVPQLRRSAMLGSEDQAISNVLISNSLHVIAQRNIRAGEMQTTDIPLLQEAVRSKVNRRLAQQLKLHRRHLWVNRAQRCVLAPGLAATGVASSIGSGIAWRAYQRSYEFGADSTFGVHEPNHDIPLASATISMFAAFCSFPGSAGLFWASRISARAAKLAASEAAVLTRLKAALPAANAAV